MSEERQSLDSLLPLVYQELRRLAAGYIRREKPARRCSPRRSSTRRICA